MYYTRGIEARARPRTSAAVSTEPPQVGFHLEMLHRAAENRWTGIVQDFARHQTILRQWARGIY
jgi:hypothetical protein